MVLYDNAYKSWQNTQAVKYAPRVGAEISVANAKRLPVKMDSTEMVRLAEKYRSVAIWWIPVSQVGGSVEIKPKESVKPDANSQEWVVVTASKVATESHWVLLTRLA